MAEETKKVITINPELLSLSGGTGRRRTLRRSAVAAPPRLRASKETTSLLKKKILQKLREAGAGASAAAAEEEVSAEPAPMVNDGEGDFDDAQKFFQNLGTLPAPPESGRPSLGSLVRAYNSDATLDENDSCEPQYGCLRGGKKPTYRAWMRTQKNYHMGGAAAPAPAAAQQPININIFSGGATPPAAAAAAADAAPDILSSPAVATPATMEGATGEASPAAVRKRIKRQFTLGKKHNKVGVLVPNKTIRQRVLTELEELALTPIADIKSYLLKKGLIKVGCTAPDSVLRKMYESTKLIGADIINHNKDVLLHNFLKAETKI